MHRVILLTSLIFVVIFADVSSAQNTVSIDSVDIAIKNYQNVRGVVRKRKSDDYILPIPLRHQNYLNRGYLFNSLFF